MISSKWISSCLLVVSAAAWTTDLRNAYEENHTVYLKAGEDIDVLVDGFNGTGYMWMNNLDYAVRKNSKADGDHIDYVSEDKYDDQIYDFLDDPMDGKMMMGGQSASKISFSTKSGEDFDEVIRFAYERPWMMKGEFPASR